MTKITKYTILIFLVALQVVYLRNNRKGYFK